MACHQTLQKRTADAQLPVCIHYVIDLFYIKTFATLVKSSIMDLICYKTHLFWKVVNKIVWY